MSESYYRRTIPALFPSEHFRARYDRLRELGTSDWHHPPTVRDTPMWVVGYDADAAREPDADFPDDLDAPPFPHGWTPLGYITKDQDGPVLDGTPPADTEETP